MSLDRKVPGNMAMAPYATDKGGLIIVQNANADSINGNLQRMRRVLAHEICHLFVREKSGSSQCLGDELKDLKVRPCLDEGLAEYISWRCIGERNPMLNEDFECIDNLDSADQILNDFNSDKRISAFYTSTCLVEFFISELGLHNFFESMTKLPGTDELPTSGFTLSLGSGCSGTFARNMTQKGP